MIERVIANEVHSAVASNPAPPSFRAVAAASSFGSPRRSQSFQLRLQAALAACREAREFASRRLFHRLAKRGAPSQKSSSAEGVSPFAKAKLPAVLSGARGTVSHVFSVFSTCRPQCCSQSSKLRVSAFSLLFYPPMGGTISFAFLTNSFPTIEAGSSCSARLTTFKPSFNAKTPLCGQEKSLAVLLASISISLAEPSFQNTFLNHYHFLTFDLTEMDADRSRRVNQACEYISNLVQTQEGQLVSTAENEPPQIGLYCGEPNG